MKSMIATFLFLGLAPLSLIGCGSTNPATKQTPAPATSASADAKNSPDTEPADGGPIEKAKPYTAAKPVNTER